MKTLVLFAHGKESGPWGTKIQLLSELASSYGAISMSPDYTDIDDPDKRVSYLLGLDLPEHDNLIMVGSSMGGYVSTVASSILKPKCLFLMAPAFYMPFYLDQEPKPIAEYTSIVFGRFDDVIPVELGIRFANRHNVDIHIIDGDHRLSTCMPKVLELFKSILDHYA